MEVTQPTTSIYTAPTSRPDFRHILKALESDAQEKAASLSSISLKLLLMSSIVMILCSTML